MDFKLFPVEIKFKIFSFLTDNELRRKVPKISEEWRRLATDPYLRKRLRIENVAPEQITNLINTYTRIKEITFFRVNLKSWVIDVPVCNHVNFVLFYHCLFESMETISLLLRRFPNARNIQLSECDFLRGGSFDRTLKCWKLLTTLKIDFLVNSLSSHWSECNCVNFVAEYCENIEDVWFGESCEISDDGFSNFICKRGKTLKKLNFEYLPSVDGFELGNTPLLTTFATNLTHLQFRINLSFQTDSQLTTLKTLSKLQVLTIEDVGNKVTSAGYVNLFQNSSFSNLRCLSLGACSHLDDEGAKSLAISCPSLEDLTLSNGRVSDIGMRDVVDHCRFLIRIKLKLMDVFGDFLVDLGTKVPNLTHFDFTSCFEISYDHLLTFKKENPTIKVIYQNGVEVKI